MTEKTKPKGKAKPIIGKSSASKYITPNVYSVAAEISADEKEFLPVSEPGSCFSQVRVIVPALNHLGDQSFRLNHRVTEVFDCGFKIKLPAGFKIRAEARSDWACRGLLVSNAYLEDEGLKLVVTNIGQETPLVIPHKANIAYIWAEPVYFFDWTVK
jgi:hypothetical protein